MNERNLQPRGGSIIYFRNIWESISGTKVLCQFLSEVNFKVEVLTDDVEKATSDIQVSGYKFQRVSWAKVKIVKRTYAVWKVRSLESCPARLSNESQSSNMGERKIETASMCSV